MHANSSRNSRVFSGASLLQLIFKDTTTGDTLCDEKLGYLRISGISIQLSRLLLTKSKADQDKMGIAFTKLAEEDPTFVPYPTKKLVKQLPLVRVESH